MPNAAKLNFIAFWRYGPNPEALTGMMLISIGVAAEAAVGLADHLSSPPYQDRQHDEVI
jgi:NADH-quinone oxidoreductase subunit K